MEVHQISLEIGTIKIGFENWTIPVETIFL